MMNSNKLN